MAPEDVLAALDKPQEASQPHEVVSTGSLALNLALGGGWPAHRISELYGDPMTGKSVLAYHAVANAQLHGVAVWLDSGSNFDPPTAVRAGVDLDKIALFRPPNVKTALEAIRATSSGTVKPTLAVLDTASGLPGTPAWGSNLAALTREIRSGGPAVLITNNRQVGQMPGGFSTAIRSARSVGVGLSRDGKDIRAFVRKNTTGMGPWPPIPQDIKIRVGGGRIDIHRELVTLGLDSGVLHKRGSWIYFGDFRLAQGVDSAASLLKDWPQGVSEIREAVIQCLT